MNTSNVRSLHRGNIGQFPAFREDAKRREIHANSDHLDGDTTASIKYKSNINNIDYYFVNPAQSQADRH